MIQARILFLLDRAVSWNRLGPIRIGGVMRLNRYARVVERAGIVKSGVVSGWIPPAHYASLPCR